MIVSTAGKWSGAPSIVLSILLAFAFGYGLTIWGLRKHDLPFRRRLKLALASDSASIGVMELADNGFVLLVPGAIAAGLNSILFWWSLLVSLAVAFIVTVPVNHWLIGRGKGHAVMHDPHLM